MSKYHIDGTDEFGCYAGDATNPPYMVHDIDAGEPVAGPFQTRAEAEAALVALQATEELK